MFLLFPVTPYTPVGDEQRQAGVAPVTMQAGNRGDCRHKG
jgi:hypothetical protein